MDIAFPLFPSDFNLYFPLSPTEYPVNHFCSEFATLASQYEVEFSTPLTAPQFPNNARTLLLTRVTHDPTCDLSSARRRSARRGQSRLPGLYAQSSRRGQQPESAQPGPAGMCVGRVRSTWARRYVCGQSPLNLGPQVCVWAESSQPGPAGMSVGRVLSTWARRYVCGQSPLNLGPQVCVCVCGQSPLNLGPQVCVWAGSSQPGPAGMCVGRVLPTWARRYVCGQGPLNLGPQVCVWAESSQPGPAGMCVGRVLSTWARRYVCGQSPLNVCPQVCVCVCGQSPLNLGPQVCVWAESSQSGPAGMCVCVWVESSQPGPAGMCVGRVLSTWARRYECGQSPLYGVRTLFGSARPDVGLGGGGVMDTGWECRVAQEARDWRWTRIWGL